jgi:hypothetical protein
MGQERRPAHRYLLPSPSIASRLVAADVDRFVRGWNKVERIKHQTIANRRLQHHAQAA